MISMEQINGEIAVLEEEKPTHLVMQKLASLYAVRDHMTITHENPPVNVSVSTVPDIGSTDFLRVISGKSLDSVFMQMDDLMTALQVLNPRLYTSTMDKLQDTH